MPRCLRSSSLWILLAGLLIGGPAQAASFMQLPFNQAWDVSADGTMVAGAGSGEPVLWTEAGGTTVLPLPVGSNGGDVRVISQDKSVSGGYSLSPNEALRWVGTSLDPASPASSSIYGLNADGSIAVGQSLGSPVRWDAGSGMTPLPGATAGLALDIMPDGSQIVGQALIPGGFHEAVVWSSGSMNELSNLGGGSAARAISTDGHTIVGRVAPFGSGVNQLAARWVDGSLETLGTAPGTFDSDAFDVSANGRVIVGFAGTSIFAGKRATIWDEAHGMRDLKLLLESEFGFDLTGLTLEEATGISDDGRVIVGNGLNATSQTFAWRAVIPEPSTASLLAIGIVGLAMRRRANAG
jgi:uncharacterized membrane protein